MEKDIMNEPLIKERSYVKSITSGFRLPLRHPWGFLRQLWPLLLLNVVVFGAVSRWMAPDLWEIQEQAFAAVLVTRSLLSWPLLKVSLWILLAIVMLGALAGQTCYLMRRYGELNYLPAVQPWKVWKDLQGSVLKGICLCVFGYLVVVLFAVLSLVLMPGRVWAFVLFFVLTFAWALVYVPTGQKFMMEDMPFFKALIWPFRSMRDIGGSSAVIIVCGLLVALVIFIGCIPAINITYVGGLSAQAVAIGDGTDIPNSFGLLRTISFALGALVAYISWIFIFVPLCFQWGSTKIQS